MAKTTRKTASKKKTPTSSKAKTSQLVKSERRLSTFEEMESMIERYFDRIFPRSWLHQHKWDWPALPDISMPFEGKRPRVDVIDHDNDIILKAELPGIEKEDVDVSMSDSTVTIKAADSHEKKISKGEYYRHEISRGAFSRTIALPAEVDGAKAKASFKDGVLEMTIPKVVSSRRRKIAVN